MVSEVVPGSRDRGTVRFIGSVDFVEDESEWFGVELDTPVGRHDGTVQGIRYFAAGKDRGVFVTLKMLEKISSFENSENLEESLHQSLSISQESFEAPAVTSLQRPMFSSMSTGISPNMSTSMSTRISTSRAPSKESISGLQPSSRPVRRSLSLRHHELKKPKNCEYERPASSTVGRPSSVNTNISRSMSVRRVGEPMKKDFHTGPSPHISKFRKSIDKKYLEVGQGVLVIHSKEMGVIRYIGHTDFAPDIWVGLELRNQKGRHNGEVQGRRYFQCKDFHGVMLKPKNISVHGINGQELLRPEAYYPI